MDSLGSVVIVKSDNIRLWECHVHNRSHQKKENLMSNCPDFR